MINGKYHAETRRDSKGKVIVIDLARLEYPLGNGYEVGAYQKPGWKALEEHHPATLDEGVSIYDALVKKYDGRETA